MRNRHIALCLAPFRFNIVYIPYNNIKTMPAESKYVECELDMAFIGDAGGEIELDRGTLTRMEVGSAEKYIFRGQ